MKKEDIIRGMSDEWRLSMRSFGRWSKPQRYDLFAGIFIIIFTVALGVGIMIWAGWL